MKAFKVTYAITVQRDSAVEASTYTITKDGYTSVEELKNNTRSVLENMIQKHEIADNQIMCEMHISTAENRKETYFDHDETVIRVKDGKIVEFMD